MIKSFLSEHGDYKDDKSFKQLTTIKMGGEIAHYVEPYSVDDLKEIIYFLRNKRIPFKIIGNGSNLICGSSRYEGVVINLKRFNNYEIKNDSVYVEAGVMAPYLSRKLAEQGLSGLEFASGIPGTIGGLVYMNAGAYKKQMQDLIIDVIVLINNEVVTLKNEELKFSYRYSIFQEHPHWIILGTNLKLAADTKEEIQALIQDRSMRRKNTQPLDKPSAGSCFRNVGDISAWKLIDSIGYRGYNLNGVEVSSKHPNFIVNEDGGCGEDYLKIALDIQEKVYKKHNIKLIMEVEKFNC